MLYVNTTIATMNAGGSYGLIPKGAVATKGDTIIWVGPEKDLPKEHSHHDKHDLGGRLTTPAPIDCHTHIVHGGHRAIEFEQRLQGISYAEIARLGGGIVSTVNATRTASQAELLATALPRVDAMINEGVSLIEVKSGYGLDQETELTMLRVARAIETHRNIRVKTTFLGAHAIPIEYKDNADAYIDDVCIPALKAAYAEGLVDAVDGFCEGIAFTPEQIERVFKCAQALGLRVKLHAEQLTNIGGTKLAAKYHALSADHIEYATEEDVIALAQSGTAAVLLPGAFYTLHETQKPPIDAFRKHNVPIALATDCNPGSSPTTSILLAMNMGCTLFSLTPEEALAGITCNAATALGLTDTGRITKGMRADLAIWNVQHPAELAYRFGYNPLHKRIVGGIE